MFIKLSSIKSEDKIRPMNIKLSKSLLQKFNIKLSIKLNTSLLNTKSLLNPSQLSIKLLKRRLNTRLKPKLKRKKRRKRKSTRKMMDGLLSLQKKEKLVKINDSC